MSYNKRDIAPTIVKNYAGGSMFELFESYKYHFPVQHEGESKPISKRDYRNGKRPK